MKLQLRRIKTILGLFILLSCHASKMTVQQPWQDEKKRIIHQAGTAQFVCWELNNHDNLWSSEVGDIPSIMEYRDTLQQELEQKILTTAIAKE